MAVYITGDTHGYIDIGKLSFERWPESRCFSDDDYLIICGDFGLVWDNSKTELQWRKWLDNKPYTTLFCSGNHDSFDLLYTFPVVDFCGGKARQISDKIFLLQRGECYNICGKKYFTMGGASSHDISDGILDPNDPDFAEKYMSMSRTNKMFRVNHVSWWKEEIPSDEEFAHAEETLKNNNYKFDYIISHCASNTIVDKLSVYSYNHDKLTDWFEDNVYNKCEYKAWFFGHYHVDNMYNGNKSKKNIPHVCSYYEIHNADEYVEEYNNFLDRMK